MNIIIPEKMTRKIKSETIPAFCKMLKSTQWTNVTSEPKPELAFQNFFEIFNSIRDVSFPEISIKQKPESFLHCPWTTKGLIISQKEKLFSKKVRKPTEINSKKFKLYNTIYNKLRFISKKM